MKSRKVAILAYPNLATFEFGCAIELFSLPRPDIKNWFQTDIISLSEKPMKATGGFNVQSDIFFLEADGFKAYDMVVLAGWSGVDVPVPSALISALQIFYNNGGTIISFCSGAFVLAATGLLDGQQATTHWRYEENFTKKFPKVNFQKMSYLHKATSSTPLQEVPQHST